MQSQLSSVKLCHLWNSVVISDIPVSSSNKNGCYALFLRIAQNRKKKKNKKKKQKQKQKNKKTKKNKKKQTSIPDLIGNFKSLTNTIDNIQKCPDTVCSYCSYIDYPDSDRECMANMVAILFPDFQVFYIIFSFLILCYTSYLFI